MGKKCLESRLGLTSGVKMDTTVEYKVEFRYYVYLVQSHVYDCNISTCCELRADAFEDNAQKASKRRPVIITNRCIPRPVPRDTGSFQMDTPLSSASLIDGNLFHYPRPHTRGDSTILPCPVEQDRARAA